MRKLSAARHSWRHPLLAFTALLYAGTVGLLTFCQPADSPKTAVPGAAVPAAAPRYAFANQAPDVRYVGTEACRSCHAAIYADYRQTGKGQAFGRPVRGEGPEEVGGPRSVVFDRASQRYYRAEWRGPDLYIAEWQLGGASGRDTTHYRAEKADYVIGSGNQTRSYVLARNGYHYEAPITWYSAKRIWDLSPGYEDGHNSGFSRPTGQQCLNCHNSQNVFVPNSVNRFTSLGNGMSCESCHGPGEKHVVRWSLLVDGKTTPAPNHQQRTTNNEPRATKDPTIVNPRHLPVSAQLDVCRQCHLEGVTVEKEGRKLVDFRPGQRLADYADVFIPAQAGDASAQFGFASHAERLQQSACFIQSANRLTCTTCHDPHKPLGPQPMMVYNAQCQNCHREQTAQACDASANVRASVNDDCVRCHMARAGTTDIPHVSSRDHLIRKRLTESAAPKSAPLKSQLVVLRSFTASADAAPDDRARVLAAMLYFEQTEANPAYLTAVRQQAAALALDARAKYAYLAQNPEAAALPASLMPAQVANPYTAFYVSQLRLHQGQPAAPWLERAVALAPANADFRYALATNLADQHQPAAAETAYRALLQLQPWHQRALVNLGYLRLLAGDFAEALTLTRRARQLDPTYALAYENEANIYLQQGQTDAALRVLEELIQRFPAQAGKYRTLRERVRAAGRPA